MNDLYILIGYYLFQFYTAGFVFCVLISILAIFIKRMRVAREWSIPVLGMLFIAVMTTFPFWLRVISALYGPAWIEK